jgi:hypothetical protein
MRIEGMGSRRIDGFAANLEVSLSQTMIVKDPIAEAAQKLAGVATTMGVDDKRQYVEVCCATEPPRAVFDRSFTTDGQCCRPRANRSSLSYDGPSGDRRTRSA